MEKALMRLWEAANADAMMREGAYIGCKRKNDEMRMPPNTYEGTIELVARCLERIK